MTFASISAEMSFSFESASPSVLIELWATYSTANLTENPEALERLCIPVGIKYSSPYSIIQN